MRGRAQAPAHLGGDDVEVIVRVVHGAPSAAVWGVAGDVQDPAGEGGPRGVGQNAVLGGGPARAVPRVSLRALAAGRLAPQAGRLDELARPLPVAGAAFRAGAGVGGRSCPRRGRCADRCTRSPCPADRPACPGHCFPAGRRPRSGPALSLARTPRLLPILTICSAATPSSHRPRGRCRSLMKTSIPPCRIGRSRSTKHEPLAPFRELDPEMRAFDVPYARAVRATARSMGGGAGRRRRFLGQDRAGGLVSSWFEGCGCTHAEQWDARCAMSDETGHGLVWKKTTRIFSDHLPNDLQQPLRGPTRSHGSGP